MADAADAPMGLRERSKIKRRDAIRRAAMTLFAERGYDNASIADIAEAAEVAPRTVTLYFPTKLELALSAGAETATRMNETFAAHRGDDLLDILDAWLAREAEEHDPQLTRLARAMHEANPGLRALSRTRFAASLEAGSEALSRRLARPANDPVVVLTTAAISAVVETYLMVLLPSEDDSDGARKTAVAMLRELVKVAASIKTPHGREPA